MSNPVGKQSSVHIDRLQEMGGRMVKEDNTVINRAEAYDTYSDSSGVHLKDQLGRAAMATTFGQLAVSMKDSQITEQFPYGLPGTGVISAITGSGTIVSEDSLLKFKTTTADGTAYAESLQALRYVPGSMAYGFFTISSFPVGKAVNAFGGIFDDEDGFGIGVLNGVMNIFSRRYNGPGDVDTDYVAQADWNMDKLDGSGPSKLNVDFTKGQVYSITYGYLGFAPITFAILSPDDGWIPFHKIKYPGTSSQTHISQPYIPIRIEIDNTGSGEAIEVGIGSLDVGIFNGGKTDSASRPIGVVGSKLLATPATTTTATGIIALRGSQTLGSRKNKISVLLNSLSWNTDTSVKGVALYVIKNPTELTPGTWAPLAADSPVEYSIDTVYDLNTGFDTGVASSLAKDQSRDLYVGDSNALLRRGEILLVVMRSTNGVVGDLILGLKELL